MEDGTPFLIPKKCTPLEPNKAPYSSLLIKLANMNYKFYSISKLVKMAFPRAWSLITDILHSKNRCISIEIKDNEYYNLLARYL